MVQPITDQVGFLGEACRAVQELSASKNLLERFRQEKEHLERTLETEKKAVTEEIKQTLKERVEEIEGIYDKEISKGQESLKKVRNKREKAKNQGMKERILEETAELRNNNKELRQEIKNLFRQERIPGFCRSRLYYALYLPGCLKDWLLLMEMFLIFFLVVPCGIYYFLPEHRLYYLIGIYFLTIVIIGGFYILVYNRTKMKHLNTLRKGRTVRDLIKTNDRKIKVITRSIKKDKDENLYNLEKYDDEIARIEKELSDIVEKKKEALNTFDKVTKTIITDEITDSKKEILTNLTKDYEEALASEKEAEVRVKEQTLFVHDNYTSYIGKEFMTPERLDELADIIRMGKAATIIEAKSVYKNLKEL